MTSSLRCGPSCSTAAAVSAPTCPAMHGSTWRCAGEIELDVVGPRVDRLVGREGERRGAERRRIDAEHEVVHDRVADQHDVDDAIARAGRGDELIEHVAQTGADRGRELVGALLVHHHVRDAAHQILAEADLRVHDPGRRDDLTGREIAEVPGDGRRADIDRHAVRGVDEAGPHRVHPVAAVHGDGDGARAAASAGCNAASTAGRMSRSVRPHCSASASNRRRRSLRSAPRSGAGHVDEIQAHDGIDHEIVEGDGLAHHRSVHLTGRRHVDHHVGQDARRAPEPARRVEGAPAAIRAFGRC